jgi:hypothetical protein
MLRDALIEMGVKSPDDDSAPSLKDFGFHHTADFVRRAYLYLIRGWGWPDGAGWANEDRRLLEDLDAYHEQYITVATAAQNGYRGKSYEEQETAVERRRLGQDEL